MGSPPHPRSSPPGRTCRNSDRRCRCRGPAVLACRLHLSIDRRVRASAVPRTTPQSDVAGIAAARRHGARCGSPRQRHRRQFGRESQNQQRAPSVREGRPGKLHTACNSAQGAARRGSHAPQAPARRRQHLAHVDQRDVQRWRNRSGTLGGRRTARRMATGSYRERARYLYRHPRCSTNCGHSAGPLHRTSVIPELTLFTAQERRTLSLTMPNTQFGEDRQTALPTARGAPIRRLLVVSHRAGLTTQCSKSAIQSPLPADSAQRMTLWRHCCEDVRSSCDAEQRLVG
jgi:hypothetical protein